MVLLVYKDVLAKAKNYDDLFTMVDDLPHPIKGLVSFIYMTLRCVLELIWDSCLRKFIFIAGRD